jgi:LmbE family N-acetylglucosaminyl deacetylase
VHQVGHRGAVLAGTPTVFEATMNRDHLARLMAAVSASGDSDGEGFDPNAPADDGNPMGTPEHELTHAVDVSAYLHLKRESMRCHRSQITDTSFFLEMPDEAFAAAFGTEWFIRPGHEPGISSDWLFL